MKRCPNCSSVYEDNMLIKCANCGADLIEDTFNNTTPFTNNNPYANYNSNSNPYGAPQFKYCSTCGNPCDPRAVICVKCGTKFNATNYNSANDKPSGGLKFLCLFIPLLGLILYLINMNDKPVSAKAYGKFALIGFIIGIVFSILANVLLFLFPILFGSISYGYDSSIYYSIIHSIF